MATQRIWRWTHVEEKAFPDLGSFIRLVNERMKRLDVESMRAAGGGNLFGNGSPEGVVTAPIGRIYEQRDTGSGDHPAWIKLTGTGNTGWRRLAGLLGTGTDAVRLGNNSASGSQGIAVGKSALASATRTLAVGFEATASGTNAIAIGYQSDSDRTDGISIGTDAQVWATAAIGGICIGTGAVLNGAAGAIGGNAPTVEGTNSVGIWSDVTIANTMGFGESLEHTIFRFGSEERGGTYNMIFRTQNIPASGNTNVAAGTWTFQGGRSTGNAAPGRFIFQTSTPGASGATLQALATRLTIDYNVITSTVPIVAPGITGTKINLAAITWGAPGAESGNAIEVLSTAKDTTDTAIAVATIEAEVMVSDSATDATPSATATIAAAAAPVGTLLSGSGTATTTWRTDANGQFKVKVTEGAAASRYLWVRQGKNSQYWVRADAAPLQLTFA